MLFRESVATRIRTCSRIARCVRRSRLLRHPSFLHGISHLLLQDFHGRHAPQGMIDAYTRCREYLDAAIALVKPGRTTAEIASVWPKAQELGFPNEVAAFA